MSLFSRITELPAQKSGHRRLGYCMLLSAAVLLFVLANVEIRLLPLLSRATKPVLDLELKAPDREAPDFEQPAADESAAEQPLSRSAGPEDDSMPEPDETDPVPAPVQVKKAVDWYAELAIAAKDESLMKPAKKYMGNLDQRLRLAADRYYASTATGPPRPIWENVEKDELGRTLLWHGDCYRVIDDPSVMNQYLFENFTQFMVFCQTPYDVGRELPWVREIVARRSYLQEEDVYRN
jgi:hypothetical protein